MILLKSLYKLRKRTLLSILGLLYLSILIVFGIVYWKIANISSGEYFVFQNDINMNTKITVFKKNLKINIHNRDFNEIINDLIKSEEYKRPVVKLYGNIYDKDNELNVFVLDKPIGEMWASYYYLLLQGKGITHMKIDSAEEQVINNKIRTYKLRISLYKINSKNKDDSYIVYKKDYNKNLEKIDTVIVWIKDYPIIEDEFLKKDYEFYPLSFYFTNLMENSMSFLDDSPLVLKSVANGNFKYPLWNFLYFSSVTITTLGYGDILPNSTIVRILVMFETIFGVVIIGMFVSCLFWNKRD
jgi:voltage-gated potassium channel